MANAIRTQRADSAHTRERILNASEQLFSERGYSGTSLRAIADLAGVNLAAANYHFGSKENLLQATFVRCMEPVNQERLERLQALESEAASLSVGDIVRAFIEPGLQAAKDPRLPALVAKLFAEPKTVSVPLLQNTFRPTASAFFSALTRALPHLEEEQLRWRFHFMIGAMIHLYNFNQPLPVFVSESQQSTSPPFGTSSDESLLEAGLDQLVHFLVAGLCSTGQQESHA